MLMPLLSNANFIHIVVAVAWVLIVLSVIRAVFYVCLVLVVAVILSTIVPHTNTAPEPQQQAASYYQQQ